MAPVEDDFALPENYKCKYCRIEVGKDVWIEESLRKEVSNLEKEIKMRKRLYLKNLTS